MRFASSAFSLAWSASSLSSRMACRTSPNAAPCSYRLIYTAGPKPAFPAASEICIRPVSRCCFLAASSATRSLIILSVAWLIRTLSAIKHFFLARSSKWMAKRLISRSVPLFAIATSKASLTVCLRFSVSLASKALICSAISSFSAFTGSRISLTHALTSSSGLLYSSSFSLTAAVSWRSTRPSSFLTAVSPTMVSSVTT